MRWLIATGMYNVAGLAADFCRYHLARGVDRIIVADYGSTDGTLEALEAYRDDGAVRLLRIPSHRFVEYDPSNELLRLIRIEEKADWVTFLDPDEFLIGPAPIKQVLARASNDGIAVIKTQRRNMIGVGPLSSSTHYLRHLTLKIIDTDERVASPTAALSSSWIFSRIPPKVTIAAAAKNITVETGDHDVRGADERQVTSYPELEILHYPMRDFSSFREKVETTKNYLAANPEFSPGIAWHWRRWIAMLTQGGLEEEYERQFPDEATALSLLQTGKAMRDSHLAAWIEELQENCRAEFGLA